MLSEFTPIPMLFFGILAFLLAWQLARGINGARNGQFALLVRPLGLMIFVAAMMFMGFGVESFTPPYMTYETWIVVAILFVIVFLINLIIIPILQRRWSATLVRAFSSAAACFLVGAFTGWTFWSTATTQVARISGMLIPVILMGIGILIAAVGIIQAARNKI